MRATLLIVTTLLFLTACSGGVGPVAPVAPAYIRLSLDAPPKAPHEIAETSPSPRTEIWRKGYWDLQGGVFVWAPGKFIPRPSPTATWSPDKWVPHAYGWAFEAGHWQ